MEKVLVSEVLYAKGHVRLNENYVKCIKQNFDVTLIDDGLYFSDLDSKEYNKIKISHHMVKRIEILKTILYANYFRKVALIAKKQGIKNVVFLSFHTDAFGLIHHLFKGINVCVVHHYEIDRMNRRPQEIKSFDKYKSTITHCVLETFIADGIIKEFNVLPDQVYVVNEPVEMVPSQNKQRKENVFIGIGQSTDQALVDELIELDKSGYLANDVKGKIILRSKTTQYKGKHVEVFTGYLQRDIYEDLYSNATACIVRYEPTYRLRSSGSINDAFRNHKKVIVMGFPAGESYSQMYPRNCVRVEKSEQIFDLLEEMSGDFDLLDERHFEETHSFKNVTEQWKKAILQNH